jgi:hypothetical protein
MIYYDREIHWQMSPDSWAFFNVVFIKINFKLYAYGSL